MKKKRFVILFGAIIITLLMISSATALNITQFKNIKEKIKNQNSGTEKERYIDPNIKLTKKDLSKLKLSVEKIDKPIYKELTKKIIQKIETKGIATSNDLKNILIELNMKNTDIYTGKIIGHAKYTSGCFGIPFIPFAQFWFGPSFFVFWWAYLYPDDVIDYTIGIQNHHITEEHEGFGIPFTGFWNHDIRGNPYPDEGYSTVFGRSMIIIINYDLP